MNIIAAQLVDKAHDRKALHNLLRKDMNCGAPTLRAAATDVLIMLVQHNKGSMSFVQKMNGEAVITHLQAIGDNARRQDMFVAGHVPGARRLVEEVLEGME
jgi:hypothetical protein